MNATKTISVLVLAAATAWSQGTTKPAAKRAAPAAKPAPTKAGVKPASQMAPATGTAKAVASKPTTAKTASAPKTSAKASTAAAKKPAVKVTTAPKVAKAKTAEPAIAKSIAPVKPLGKRDPFVSVIVSRSDSSAACTGGKRCLQIDQIALRGIVRTPSKWIALVENPARKTYYL